MAPVARIPVAGLVAGASSPFTITRAQTNALARTTQPATVTATALAMPRVLALCRPNQPFAVAGSKMATALIHTSPTRALRPSSTKENMLAPTPSPFMPPEAPPPPSMSSHQSPLSVLPFHMIIRSLFTSTVSSSRLLLPPSLALMSVLAHTSNPILNPDRNPVLRWAVKKTFYAQFCAGETAPEVRSTISGLKDIGFTGVIMGYAREVVLTKDQVGDLKGCTEGRAADECIRQEIRPWEKGTKETVELASPGDFVALKFTGAGRQALHTLKERLPPPPALAAAIDNICSRAAERGVRLLFDAEQAAVQAGIDDWTVDYMRKYNTNPDRAVIYGTYQAYLKSTPATLASHLEIARRDGFTLGVKLVRGAYIGSDPRHLIHDTKEETDACYDGVSEAMLKRRWNNVLQKPGDEGKIAPIDAFAAAEPDEDFPNASLVLASHNALSVKRARAIVEAGEAKLDVAFGQLQGMADEISCELVAARKQSDEKTVPTTPITEEKTPLQAYKYLVWGSTGECMKYLLRRAHENRDAVSRTRDGRDAMFAELIRRAKKAVGF